MKSNYARKLNNSNILLGIHIAFKLVMILTLFVLLYSTIWVKEKYLTIIKSSVYIQIFIFLTTVFVMLSINNPKSFDICIPFLNYFYLIISILQLGIIFCEIYFLIKNLQNFINIFHECPYYRTYEEIIDKDYKRTCLYYILDYNNELPFKYICYYNSENEYHNKFCDGFICKKNYDQNEINSYIRCYGNVDRNSIHFSGDNEFYLKEIELINRYKSSNLYACFRKEKIEKNESIFNKECPDSNPINKMLIFIYCDIILHILVDFLFIYEFFLIRKVREIYSNLVLLQSRAPINYLENEDEFRNGNNSNTNKQTNNTDNKELMEYPQSLYTFNMPRENSETIIIEPGFANNNKIINIYQDSEKSLNTQNQLTNFDNIEINYNEKNNNSKIKQTKENKGVINREAKIFNNKKRKNIKNNKINIIPEDDNKNTLSTKNKKQRMVMLDIKKDEEYGINRINFFIKKKTKKKRNKIQKEKEKEDIKENDINLNNNSNEDIHTINTNIKINDNKNDIKIGDGEDKKIQKININSKFKSKNNVDNSIESESLSSSKDSKKKKKSISINNRKLRKNMLKPSKVNMDIKNNSNIIVEKNNNCMIGFKKELSENYLYSNALKKNNSGDKIILNSLKNDILKKINIYKINNQQINEEKAKSKQYKNLINSSEREKIKENQKIINKENKNDIKDNTNENKNENSIKGNKIESLQRKFLEKIHINSEVFLNEEES